MDRNDRPPEQPTPHARTVIEAIAAYMEAPPNRGRLLTRIGVQRAFNIAVAARLHDLPTAVADEVSDRVAELLPDTGPTITHGEYAKLLRQVAEGLS